MDPTTFSYLLNVDLSSIVPSLPPMMYEGDSLDGASGGGLSDYVGIKGTDLGITGSDSPSFKTRLRLSAEEKKEKIQKYIKKRNERNFTKKIKYACRKTLADCRLRVRGRFAKNEDYVGDTVMPNYNIGDQLKQMELKVEDIFESSDIFAHVSGINSFTYEYPLESWM